MSQVHEVISAGLAEGVASAISFGVWSRNHKFEMGAFGMTSFDEAQTPTASETFFDWASVTKVIAGATLTALLVERGSLRYETKVKSILTDFVSSEIEIRHLLSHTAGFIDWVPLWKSVVADFPSKEIENVSVEDRWESMRRAVLKISPAKRPEEQVLYSDVGVIVLSLLLREVLGEPLQTSVRKLILNPLGMKTAHYRIAARFNQKRDIRYAATENCPWRNRVLQGEAHDENCFAMGGVSAHAGLFGRAEDLVAFGQGLLSGFLSSFTLEKMWAIQKLPAGNTRTLGWDTPSGDLPSSGKFFGKGTVGHLGFTGTSLWIDPRQGLVAALLTNRVHPTRDNQKIRKFRPEFHDALGRDWGL